MLLLLLLLLAVMGLVGALVTLLVWGGYAVGVPRPLRFIFWR
jgi:hypothetical protein